MWLPRGQWRVAGPGGRSICRVSGERACWAGERTIHPGVILCRSGSLQPQTTLPFWEHLPPSGPGRGPEGQTGRLRGINLQPEPPDLRVPPDPLSTWRLTIGSVSSRPHNASRAPLTWPPFWAHSPHWAASTSPTRSRPCRVSGPPQPCSRGDSLRASRRVYWGGVKSPIPPASKHVSVLCAIRRPRLCIMPSRAREPLFLGFPGWRALPTRSDSCRCGWPGGQTHLPESGSLCLPPTHSPDFSLLGIISKSLQLFKKEREREELIGVM